MSCKIDGCNRPEEGRRGICKSHAQRVRNGGWESLFCLFCDGVKPFRGKCPCQICRSDECDRPQHQRGYCQAHYMKLYRYGPSYFSKQKRCSCGNLLRTERAKWCVACKSLSLREASKANNYRRRVRSGAVDRDYTVKALLDIDGDSCYLCGEVIDGAPSVDHILPLSKGGKDCITNVALAHWNCNNRKRAKLVIEIQDIFPNIKVPKRHEQFKAGAEAG